MMKLKSVVTLSVGALLLMAGVQVICTLYAYRSVAAQAEEALDKSFVRAFRYTVMDKRERSLSHYPDGTILYFQCVPPDSSYAVDNEKYTFYVAQQESAVLQDYYGLPEISLDTLCMNLENELRHEGISGVLSIVKGKEDEAGPRQVYADGTDSRWPGLRMVSGKAYLHRTKGVYVQSQLFIPFYQGIVGRFLLFNATTLMLMLLVVGTFWSRSRRLRKQQAGIDRQKQNFYLQAKNMESPMWRMKEDIAASAWEPAREASRHLLDAVEETLTEAKLENRKLQKRRWGRFAFSWWLSLVGIVLLMAFWTVYIYRTLKQETIDGAQVCLEQVFNSEAGARFEKAFDAVEASGESWLTYTPMPTRQALLQLDSLLKHCWVENLSRGNPDGEPVFMGNVTTIDHSSKLLIGANDQILGAYHTQGLIEDRVGDRFPFDKAYVDSAFNGELRRKDYPVGRLHFFCSDSDSLASGLTTFVTRAFRVREEQPEKMQGVMQVPVSYLVRSAWYLFLPLVQMLVFTLSCIYIQWRIARRQRKQGQFRRDFTYAMIHDMKSPLQSVLMGSQIMASGKLGEGSEKAARIVSAMQDECDHLLALSHRVVTLTQIERGELQLHKTEVSLRPLLDDLCAKFRLKAPKPVSFEVDCADGLCVTADAFCLREVLSNLVDNAVKYSRREVRIRLSALRTAGGVSIRVRDNGIGIPARDRQRIFGKFERVASGRLVTGFGLGLSFVRQVVQAHGGMVSVQSDGRSYSEFVVLLPQ